MTNLRVRVGRRLRELRVRAKLSQAEVGRRSGIHRPIVARVERGVHDPGLDTVARLCTAIGCKLRDVLIVLDVHPRWVIREDGGGHMEKNDVR
jgi:transcriptional regulator with XRE-family HTH domain